MEIAWRNLQKKIKQMRINGGFFVLEPKVLDYIENDQTSWEREPMERLSSEKQLMAYFHNGFWQPMDTLREYRQLEALWESGQAPWKKWNIPCAIPPEVSLESVCSKSQD